MKKALVVRGGWDGHEPIQCTDRIIPYLKEQDFEVDVHESTGVFADEALMMPLSLVVPCWTMGRRLAPEEEQGLLKAVHGGVGIAGWHGGMCDAFRANTGYQWMTGGQFVEHPGGMRDYEVNVVKPGDPIMAGIGDFKMHSEQYYLHVDPSNEVLATTTFSGEHAPWIEGCVMPVVWKRMYGAGRVFYSALGHVASEFDIREVRVIIERGMLWAAR